MNWAKSEMLLHEQPYRLLASLVKWYIYWERDRDPPNQGIVPSEAGIKIQVFRLDFLVCLGVTGQQWIGC